MADDTNSEPPKLPNSLKRELESNEKESKPEGNIWGMLRQMKKAGQFKGEITEIIPKDFNITQAPHYYVVDDLRKRSIKCIACPIIHGGVLEAHLLTRYKIEDGILYFDGVATNRTPEGFSIDNR